MPQTYEEAMNCENADERSKTMDGEINSLIENQTFVITEIPANKNVINGKWDCIIIVEADGQTKCKARYVANGFTQQIGVDFVETFSPTAIMSSLRMLLQACVDQDLKVHQLDVKTACLHAPLDYEIYMEQPQGYSISSDRKKFVWSLHKSLYGLRHSGRNWNFVLRDHLIESGSAQSKAEYYLFVGSKKGKRSFLLYFGLTIVLLQKAVILW